MSKGNARARVVQSASLVALLPEGRPGEIQWATDGQVGVVRNNGGALDVLRFDTLSTAVGNFSVQVGAQAGSARTYRIQALTNGHGCIVALTWKANGTETLLPTIDVASPEGCRILNYGGPLAANTIYVFAPGGDVTVRLTASGAETFNLASWVNGIGQDISEGPTAYGWV